MKLKPKMNRVRAVKSDFGDESDNVWTISGDQYCGWETDSGCPGYGLSKEEADFYVMCINKYIDESEEEEE